MKQNKIFDFKFKENKEFATTGPAEEGGTEPAAAKKGPAAIIFGKGKAEGGGGEEEGQGGGGAEQNIEAERGSGGENEGDSAPEALRLLPGAGGSQGQPEHPLLLYAKEVPEAKAVARLGVPRNGVHSEAQQQLDREH